MPYKDPIKNKEFVKRWKAEHKDYLKAQAWKNYLKRHYHLTVEEYEHMKSLQNNKCALCDSMGRLAIDHDHKTGKVRGLLCIGCNTQLGMFESYRKRIPLMIQYLEKWS